MAGSEAEHLFGALERLRTTFRWKADGLDSEQLRVRVGASRLSLGGLLKHLAFVEDFTTTVKLAGRPPGDPWDPSGWDDDPDWEFTSADADSAEDLYALWEGAVDRSRERFAAAVADGGLDRLVAADDGEGHHASLRRLVCDLVEEYGRHTGHADLLREAVDGRVGEDPPDEWRPIGVRQE